MVGQPASFIFVVIIDDDVVVCVKTKNAHNCEKNGTTAKQNVQLQKKWHNCEIVRRNHTRN
jgi:hypothetical protein